MNERKNMEAEAAAALLRAHWGLRGELERLAGYEDRNFLLTTADGERRVLKVSAPEIGAELLDFQIRLLERVQAADLDLATPQVIATKAGERVVALPGGEHARLLSYLPGTLWVAAEERPAALYRELGVGLAELDRVLLGWSHPAAARDLRWDLRHAGRQRRHLPVIDGSARQQLAESVFHLFAACAVPRFAELRRSVIHNDANDYNLLLASGPDGPRLTGLLDFGDAVETFTVCEPAIAAAYAMLGTDDPLACAAHIVAGYDSVLPLLEAEFEVLFPLILTRLAASATIAARRRREDPDNAYLYVTEGPAWELLDLLVPLDPAAVRDRFLHACGRSPDPAVSAADLLARRRRVIGLSLSVAYREPLHIVRGRGPYLYSERGRPYLDLVNNVCHVGHCHPRVVAAGARQMAILNTNTRYLYEGLTAYAERLCSTLPEPLEICFFVTSGSEANELALRMARTHTGRRDLLVLEGAYHGHTGGLIEISPYKFRGPGGSGEPAPHVHVVPVPDGYRGAFKGKGAETGERYASEVARAIDTASAPIAAFISESVLGCGGQIVPPDGYLDAVYRHVRAAGGLCIADEVQVGFGRVGSRFWAFELQDVVPDIVVLGKPIGNGHPMAAVIARREIAESFANGMEFFSTFGGNPVSCAIGMAVLDVIEDEALQQRAADLGDRFLGGLRRLQQRHRLIGEVRGRGLFLGLELVRDRDTLEPAAEEAARVVEAMQRRGILLATDGPLHNVIKIKPPLVLDEEDVEMTLRTLDRVLEGVST